MSDIRRAYVQSEFGQLHFAECGSGDSVVLMLHQTPRSWDEFREVLPLIGQRHRAIAMDMLGFGQSAYLAPPQSVEQYAAGALALLDGLGVERAAVFGHHTGATVAIEVAAVAPQRVSSVVLSSPGYADAERRAHHAQTGPPVDVATRNEDGSHLLTLWQSRARYYAQPHADLLDRYVHDALAWGVDPAEGHRAANRYHTDERIGLVHAPVLVLAAEQDPFALPNFDRVCAALTGASSVQQHRIADGGIALMERCAAEVATAVLGFLDSQSHGGAAPR